MVLRRHRRVFRDARPYEPKGWRGIGAVNEPRLERFQQYLSARPADSLETLIRDDRRFRDARQNIDAYAEAWALTYFLINKRPAGVHCIPGTVVEEKAAG